MGWFRRRRDKTTTSPPGDQARGEDRHLPVPVASAPALARTERALQMLATQSAQLHSSIVQLEHRIDAMSQSLLEQMDRPSYDDVLEARMQTAKVAAELSRLEVNLAARIDTLRGQPPSEIDLRTLTPADTGY
ncbi:MAG: hypothetical protein U5K30_04180 [Acidimicrobiales bacterium]|nr:hypothetical protein [Acidimicrobiales bacterium]